MNLNSSNLFIHHDLLLCHSSQPSNPAENCFIAGQQLAIKKLNDGTISINRPWFDTSPVFYQTSGGKLHISEDWGSLLNEPEIDIGYVQDYVRYQVPNTEHTFVYNILYLRNGEILEIDPKGAITLKNAPLPDDIEIDLKDALENELKKLSGNTVFHLSSGLDSTLLAILASHIGMKVNAATFITLGRGATQELSLVEQLCTDFNFALEVYDFKDIDLWKVGNELIYNVFPFPISHPSHLVRYLLDRELVHNKYDVIVTGRGPDELLGGYEQHLESFNDPCKHLMRLTCTPDEIINNLFPNPIKSYTTCSQKQFVVNDLLTLDSRLKYDLRSIYEAWNIIDYSLSKHFNIMYTNPFLEYNIARFMYHRPLHEKLEKYRQKVFLRQTFADLYPKYILDNNKQGLRIDLRDYFKKYTSKDIMEQIYNDSDFTERYLNKKYVEFMIEQTLTDGQNFGWQLWNIYLCKLTHNKIKQH